MTDNLKLFDDLPFGAADDIKKAGGAKRRNAAKGYPKPPGSGPQGETCRSCKNAESVSGGAKNYWKCGLLKHCWTHGLGTDIRLKSPACSFWEAK